ncbi:GNAT family N-acetyltransferase [Mariniphaga sp.]|uniref:GNAT family N-acetyltransferase n=1 Tax=Mariniphaga sp. TaxID=1954475 RepID=UPI00356131A0
MTKQLLHHGKIILRPLEPDDIELLYRWENNMEVWELSNTHTPYSKYVLAEYIKNSVKDIYETKQLRLIIENWEKHPVGAVDLFDFDPFHQRAGVGILIHSTEDRNRGFATDALEALSKYAIHALGLKQLYANIAADNLQSIRLFEKTGFIQTGIKKEWLKTISGWKDEILFQKLLV